MKAVWSAEADRDRDAIFAHIEEHDPSAAFKLDMEISKIIFRLEQFPNSGRPGRLPGTREAVIGSYILVYKVLPNALLITQLVHGARKFPPTRV